MGFGLNLSVVTDPAKSRQLFGPGGLGTFSWPGAYGTWWQADPTADLILIYLIQNHPRPDGRRRRHRGQHVAGKTAERATEIRPPDVSGARHLAITLRAMAQPTVLICRTDIAGPSLAYWLTKYGYRVTVAELADGIRPGGQTVDLRGAGARRGRADGADGPDGGPLTVPARGSAMCGPTAAAAPRCPSTAFNGNGPVSKLEILRRRPGRRTAHRPSHQRRCAVSVQHTHRRAWPRTTTGVDVTFTDGSRTRADVVVGADGPHSTVRRLAFGPEEEFVKPLGGYNAWFTAPDTVGLDSWYLMYQAPGLNASLRPSHDPAIAKAGLAFRSGAARLRSARSRCAADAAGRPVRRRGLGVRCAAGGRAGGRRFLLRLVRAGAHAVVVVGTGGPRRRRRVLRVAAQRHGYQPGVGRRVHTGRRTGARDRRESTLIGLDAAFARYQDRDAAVRGQVPGSAEHRRPVGTEITVRRRRQRSSSFGSGCSAGLFAWVAARLWFTTADAIDMPDYARPAD